MAGRYIGKKQALALLIMMGFEKDVMQRSDVSPKEYREARALALAACEKALPLMYQELRTTKSKARKKILVKQIEREQDRIKRLSS